MKSIIFYVWILVGLWIGYVAGNRILKDRKKYGVEDLSDNFIMIGTAVFVTIFWPAFILKIIYDEIVKLYWVIRALLLIKKHKDKEKKKHDL